MAALSWNDKFSLDVKELGEQHKRLLALMGNLHAATLDGKGKEAMGKVLNGLISYTAGHFAAEERLMKAHGYPEFEEHRQIHER